MKYAEWVKTVPDEIKSDTVWKVEAYRLALFAADIGWLDVVKIAKDGRTSKLSSQLYDALGSVGANICEGYGRGSARDRVRFYEYSLGSARESRHWYYGSRHVLGEEITAHRVSLQTQVLRLLLTMIPQQRGYTVQEEAAVYETLSPRCTEGNEDSDDVLKNLLENVPVPE